MRVTLLIPIANCKLEGDTPINRKVLRYASMLLTGSEPPAVKAHRGPNAEYVITDGRHRFIAHKLCGRTHIKAHMAIKQDPHPYKPLVHGPDKPIVPKTFDDLPATTCYQE